MPRHSSAASALSNLLLIYLNSSSILKQVPPLPWASPASAETRRSRQDLHSEAAGGGNNPPGFTLAQRCRVLTPSGCGKPRFVCKSSNPHLAPLREVLRLPIYSSSFPFHPQQPRAKDTRRQPRGQGTHVEEGAPSFALCSAASPSNGSSDKRRQRARTYRIKRLGSQELLELLELLLVLVQDVPLLLGQGTQAGDAARGAGQGMSAQPVLALRTSGFPPSLPVLSFCWRGQGCPRELPVLTCSGWWRAARSAARSPASEAGRPELRSGSPGSR